MPNVSEPVLLDPELLYSKHLKSDAHGSPSFSINVTAYCSIARQDASVAVPLQELEGNLS